MKVPQSLVLAMFIASCHGPGYEDHGNPSEVPQDSSACDWELRDQETSALIASGCVGGLKLPKEIPSALVRLGQRVRFTMTISQVFADWQPGLDQQPSAFWCAQQRRGFAGQLAGVDCYHPTEYGKTVARLISAENIGRPGWELVDADSHGQIQGVYGYALTLEVLKQGAFSRIMDACSSPPYYVLQDVEFLFPD